MKCLEGIIEQGWLCANKCKCAGSTSIYMMYMARMNSSKRLQEVLLCITLVVLLWL